MEDLKQGGRISIFYGDQKETLISKIIDNFLSAGHGQRAGHVVH